MSEGIRYQLGVQRLVGHALVYSLVYLRVKEDNILALETCSVVVQTADATNA